MNLYLSLKQVPTIRHYPEFPNPKKSVSKDLDLYFTNYQKNRRIICSTPSWEAASTLPIQGALETCLHGELLSLTACSSHSDHLARMHALYCVMLHTATHCNRVHHTATHCVHGTALWESILQLEPFLQNCILLRCSKLPHTTTHCNTLQQTAPHQYSLFFIVSFFCSWYPRGTELARKRLSIANWRPPPELVCIYNEKNKTPTYPYFWVTLPAVYIFHRNSHTHVHTHVYAYMHMIYHSDLILLSSCNTLQHTKLNHSGPTSLSSFDTLQHSATHCDDILQDSATHQTK